jgi:DUF1365 family protein
VRKVIRSEATEFRYERGAQPLPKIGPWRDRLDPLLLANELKAPLTLIRIFEELRVLGYEWSSAREHFRTVRNMAAVLAWTHHASVSETHTSLLPKQHRQKRATERGGEPRP